MRVFICSEHSWKGTWKGFLYRGGASVSAWHPGLTLAKVPSACLCHFVFFTPVSLLLGLSRVHSSSGEENWLKVQTLDTISGGHWRIHLGASLVFRPPTYIPAWAFYMLPRFQWRGNNNVPSWDFVVIEWAPHWKAWVCTLWSNSWAILT